MQVGAKIQNLKCNAIVIYFRDQETYVRTWSKLIKSQRTHALYILLLGCDPDRLLAWIFVRSCHMLPLLHFNPFVCDSAISHGEVSGACLIVIGMFKRKITATSSLYLKLSIVIAR